MFEPTNARLGQEHLDAEPVRGSDPIEVPRGWPAIIPRWAGPAMVVLAGAVMLCWSWRTWPDVVIDFGRELYVPWQLAGGKTLYSDIAYFNGPLSPYVNALWFRLFGESLRTLAICNTVILAGLVCLLYRILSDLSDRLSATAACLVFVTCFACVQIDRTGNYNYVCPYSHEMTHGITLAMLAVSCLFAYHRHRRLRWIAGAGLSLGLLFLTKVEVFASTALALMVGMGLTVWLERPSGRRLAALGASLVGPALVPPLAAFLLLCSALPASQALEGVLGFWLLALNQDVASMRFYRWVMGTLDPGESVRNILNWTLWYAAILVPSAAVALAVRRSIANRTVMAIGVFVLLVIIVGASWRKVVWAEALLPLPLLMLSLNLIWPVLLFRRRFDRQAAAQLIRRLTVALLALALLGKIILNARLCHYGFALAMPATMLLVITLISWAPALISKLGGCGGVMRAAGLAVILVAVFGLLNIANLWFDHKSQVVASGSDTFRADGRGVAVNFILDQINKRTTADQTLAVLPEGVMLNYLSRRVNPTPYINFMPLELVAFGEGTIVRSFEEHPPDFIAIVHKDTSEYGFQYFGRDYGRRLMGWVKRNYDTTLLAGAPPLQSRRFGILLLERRNRARPVDRAADR